MYTDANTHMAELKKLYDQIHKNDAPPANESEEQAALVLNAMQAMLMLMVQNNVDSNILELSMFYHWFRMITLLNRCEEADFNCSSQESSRPWPDIKAHSWPGLFVNKTASWPELNVTGPGLSVTGLES